MKNIAFLMNTNSGNESDVLGIIVHLTEEGLRRLEFLQDRAADFTFNWTDPNVNSIGFELPDGVTVCGLDNAFEDERFFEIGSRKIAFSLENAVLSENDGEYLKRYGRSLSRLIVTEEDLEADDIYEIEANYAPDWTLNRFTVVFKNFLPYLAATFENTDGGEKTDEIDLIEIGKLINEN